MLSPERQSARMSKTTNNGLAQDASYLYPCGSSGRQVVRQDLDCVNMVVCRQVSLIFLLMSTWMCSW